MRKLNVLIAGSTGYIGVQLIKLLLKHNNINIKYLCGNSSVGKTISFFDKSLKNINLPKISKFKKEYLQIIDVIFTALPNGEAQKLSNDLLSLSSIDHDGKINTIIMNKEEKDQTLEVKYNDSKINLVVPKRSIITLIKNQ